MHPLLFLLSFILPLTTGFPLNETLPPLSPLTPSLSSQSDHCDATGSWQAYAFLVEDCFVAIQQIYMMDVMRHRDETFEFTARGARPSTKHPRVQTPAVVTVSSCTLAIVMLDWFKGGALPGSSAIHSGSSDTSSFAAIWKAAKTVEDGCLLQSRRPGWQAVGTKGELGVFLWATESEINQRVTGFSAHGGIPLDLNVSNADEDAVMSR